jgi:hypothetical protein
VADDELHAEARIAATMAIAPRRRVPLANVVSPQFWATILSKRDFQFPANGRAVLLTPC